MRAMVVAKRMEARMTQCCRWLVTLALTCGPVLANADASVVERNGHAYATSIEAKHSQQVGQHHSGRDDARSQVIAALMLRNAPWADPIASDGAPTIAERDADSRHMESLRHLERALQRGANDPLVLWLIANQSYRPEARALAEAAAHRLVQVDSDNAAAWLLLLELERSTLTAAEQDALLVRAANASRHGLYHTDFVRMLVHAYASVPAPPQLTKAIQASVPSAPSEAVPYLRAIGTSLALAIPSWGTASALCRDTPHVSRRESCQALGRLMSTSSDEYIGLATGMSILQRAADSPQARAEADDVRRCNTWRHAAYSEIIGDVDPDGIAWSVVAPYWQQPDVSEIGIQDRVLAAAGIPLEPPADFSLDAD